MIRCQATQYLTVGGSTMAVWEVRDLELTPEVSSLIVGGQLRQEDEDGNFPDPPRPPDRCCGG